jgi:riboflavin kinase/FMN adenylyltransferase
MRLFRHFDNLPAEVRGASIAIGNFDGVHLGHQAVIDEAGRIARSLRVPWAVLTLEPHPRSVFHPEAPPFRLTPFHLKARLIEELGVDLLVVLQFDAEFARLPPREFVQQVLVNGLAARSVVCGHNFAFGRGRLGNPDLLLHLGGEFGFDFICVQEVRDDTGEPYSSSRVRDSLRRGDLADAVRVLGRPYAVEGRVIAGQRRGRSLGFPTANLRLDEMARPAFGVYAVRAGIADGGEIQWHDGVANLGVRPTFGGSDVLLEAHLFDFDGDLYGRHLRVTLIEYLRGEKRFDGIDALQAQIAADCAEARRLLATARPRDDAAVRQESRG